jgi:TetR/AcrR family transcriptional regulator, cholesterol catabolism regulator
MEQNDLIKRVMEIFSMYGVRTASLDFIAQTIPVAKKKLSDIAKNKEQLIRLVFAYRLERSGELYAQAVQNAEVSNAIDELLFISITMKQAQDDFKPMLDFEFSKYYPQAYEEYKQQIHSYMLHGVRENILRGKQEGVYRNDVDVDIASFLYLDTIYTLHAQVLNKKIGCSSQTLFAEALINHIRGISSLHGIEYFEQKKDLVYQYLDECNDNETNT